VKKFDIALAINPVANMMVPTIGCPLSDVRPPANTQADTIASAIFLTPLGVDSQ
jgi:hypothetical protein